MGPATQCDEMSHFPVILSFLNHRKPLRMEQEGTHLSAHISLNTVDIQTYDAPEKWLISMPTYKYNVFKYDAENGASENK